MVERGDCYPWGRAGIDGPQDKPRGINDFIVQESNPIQNRAT